MKQARYNLATTIRTRFYTLLVAQETVRVNKALAHFTDEIFRLQADLLGGGFAASHEPAGLLRSQAFIGSLSDTSKRLPTISMHGNNSSQTWV